MDTQKEMYQAQIARCKEDIKKDPADLTPYATWLTTIANLGIPEDELEIYGRAIETNLNTKESYNNFGDFLTDHGRYEDALLQYQKTLNADPGNIHANLTCGILFQRLGKDEEAIEHYQKVLAKDPQLVLAYSGLGISLGNLGRYDEAIEQYNRALDVDPDYIDPYYNLGTILLKLGRYDEAIEHYEKVVEVDPDYVDAYSGMGISLVELGRHEEAVEQYNKALAVDPYYVDAHYNLGLALEDLHKNDEAIEQFQRVIQINPEYLPAYHSWGMALDAQGKHKNAIEIYEKALARKLESASVFNSWGTSLYNLGQYEEALDRYTLTLKKDPDFIDAHYNMGLTFDNLGRYEEAASQYKKTIEKAPNYIDAYHNLALAFDNLGRHDEAIEVFLETITRKIENASIYNSWGSTLHKIGRYEEAIEKYQKALNKDPKYTMAYNNLGLALDSLGRYTDAIEQYKNTLNIDPDNVFAYGSWGYSLDRLGRHKDAIEKYEKALQINPDYIDAYNNMGLALERLSQYDEAIEQYEKALQKDSGYLYAYFNKGLVLEKLCRYEDSIAEYQKAYEKDPSYAYAAHNIASINERTGALKEADKWWANAVKAYKKGVDKARNNRDSSHFFYYAQIYHYSFKTDFNTAKEIYLDGLAIDPQNTSILLGLAKLYLDLKNQEIDFRGEKPLVEIKSEGHWKAQEYLNKSETILKKQIKQRQDNYLYLDLGEVYFLMGETRFDQAIHYLNHALQKNPNTSNIAETLALIYLQKGQYKKAISYFEQELAVSPDDLNILCMQADSCLKANLKVRAESIYKEILDINQNHIKALLGLGEIYTQKGERDKENNELGFAEENFTQALDYYTKAFTVEETHRAHFERGLNKKEMASLLYSNAYAKVMLYESQQGRNKNLRLLLEAKNDFTKIKNNYKHSQNYYRADVARKRIIEQLKPSQESATVFGAKAIFAFACMIFLVAQFCFIFGQPIFGSSYAINNDRLHKIMSEGKSRNIQFGADIEKILNDLAKQQFTSLDNFLVIISKNIEETTREKGTPISKEAFKYLISEIDTNNVLQRSGRLQFVGFSPLTPPYYALISFGSLLCMAAGSYLRETTRFKVGAIELEKRSSEQPTTSGSLGISRGLTGISKR